jgi:S1-C subfamily serine protease
VADKFERVRLLKIAGYDLALFEFDFDLTWIAFFMSPDGTVIYGRYGGRDAKGPDTRQSLAGLKYAMQAALETHNATEKPAAAPKQKPFFIESLPTAKRFKGCIHCHYVKEIRWAEDRAAGKFNREEIWSYPLPENIGITLDIDRGNVVQSVSAGSPADKAGLKPGDVLDRLNGNTIRSFADAQYGLHRAPIKGEIPISWKRDGKVRSAQLAVADGWRKTNITWRPSLLDQLPSMRVYGVELTAKEKKDLGLGDNRLAFRQDNLVHPDAQAIGIKENDVIIGLDNQAMEMSMEQFLGHVRRNYLVGDRVTLNVIREGKRLDLPMKLR